MVTIIYLLSFLCFSYSQSLFSLSGLGSGGNMAVQIHIAYSADVIGVGAIAAAPYFCAQGSEITSKTACGLSSYLIKVESLVQYTKEMASADNIDDYLNLGRDNIWLFSGSLDTETSQETVKKLQDYYSHFINNYKINTTYDVSAENAWITNGEGNPCWYLGSPFISNCKYDGAGLMLKQIYGPLQPPMAQNFSNLYSFEQSEFVNNVDSGMLTNGWIYQPYNCAVNNTCKIHVAIHGCGMNFNAVGDEFVKQSGLNQWAEANDIVVIYPQVLAQQIINPAGCWDWWGYTGSNYAWKSGLQPSAIYQMTQNIELITANYRPGF